MKKDNKEKRERLSPQMMRRAVLRWCVDIIVIIFASAVYSFGVKCFVSPNNIAPGGVTGICVILTEVAPLKLGTLIMLLNIPLLILGFVKLQRSTMIKTVVSILTVTLCTDYAGDLIPIYNADGGNGIMAALFGGALMGIGLGINYHTESTSGGTDIVIKIIQRSRPDFKISSLTALFNTLVVSLGMLVYNDINVVLYAVVTIFVQSRFIDFIVYGTQESRFLLIFSEYSREISQKLLETHKGVTLLKAEGAYSGSERQVIATAVHRSAYSKVKRIIREADPKAFVITTSAGEVLGRGFTKL